MIEVTIREGHRHDQDPAHLPVPSEPSAANGGFVLSGTCIGRIWCVVPVPTSQRGRSHSGSPVTPDHSAAWGLKQRDLGSGDEDLDAEWLAR